MRSMMTKALAAYVFGARHLIAASGWILTASLDDTDFAETRDDA